MTQTAALYHLQSLDSQIDAARKRLDDVNRQLGDNAALREAQAAVDVARADLTHWQTRQTDLDLERRQLKEEADTLEERLYSGRVSNPRELEDIQHKVAELHRRWDSLEEPVLEAMLEIEQHTADLAGADADLERVTQEQADTTGELTAEKATLTASLADLTDRAEALRKTVDASYLRLYDSLRAKAGGIAVAELSCNHECGVCGVQITSRLAQQVGRDEVLTCPTCGRILVTGR